MAELDHDRLLRPRLRNNDQGQPAQQRKRSEPARVKQPLHAHALPLPLETVTIPAIALQQAAQASARRPVRNPVFADLPAATVETGQTNRSGSRSRVPGTTA